jgi:hypothetical protein
MRPLDVQKINRLVLKACKLPPATDSQAQNCIVFPPSKMLPMSLLKKVQELIFVLELHTAKEKKNLFFQHGFQSDTFVNFVQSLFSSTFHPPENPTLALPAISPNPTLPPNIFKLFYIKNKKLLTLPYLFYCPLFNNHPYKPVDEWG